MALTAARMMRWGCSGCTREKFVNSSRLIYLMGPSGSGKDTVLGLLPGVLQQAEGLRLHIARRTITRATVDEAAEAVTAAEFQRRLKNGDFALHWHSHGLSYGIGIEIDAWLAQGAVVLVNGSREHLPSAHARYPELTAVSLVVSPDVLAQRLAQRARENAAAMRARLARAQTVFAVPLGCKHVSIANHDAPVIAAQALAQVVLAVARSAD